MAIIRRHVDCTVRDGSTGVSEISGPPDYFDIVRSLALSLARSCQYRVAMFSCRSLCPYACSSHAGTAPGCCGSPSQPSHRPSECAPLSLLLIHDAGWSDRYDAALAVEAWATRGGGRPREPVAALHALGELKAALAAGLDATAIAPRYAKGHLRVANSESTTPPASRLTQRCGACV